MSTLEALNLINALTVDVEDYYQVEAFSDVVKREDWPKWESRVDKNTHNILKTFAEHQVRATFFTLGCVAKQHPEIVREIAAAGHEVACHGENHQLIYRQTPEEFRQDIRSAKRRLEDLIGAKVTGYRAPSYSITPRSLWALDILIEEGFEYDSSIFPIHHDRYGIPNAERFPHII
ncbi:MAG TPA: polysaccharide deacetylase family protein, partial [Blastocatellia bacterium]|nr:polysaccharide deacetylase family protein [Blastocatellia bacterium]